ncbi:amidohydrolase family protein [Deinococcus cellulosilyticus]|uniref:Aminodeoxyfutalosine deaminase n=1 Tax=Deinococcus cellulosilyticus (strain DSM 18568 / NBRC 106333 / KACC 11606 / 5516J-15) TaxID=1223518 RepID=A0A511N8S0_DEIC1|nr:amidohydrolase family protein [Deinococcus cellulosilyticus]GEM49202.1 aminodeoxyfutalosine deaminase [Deinococcus cellulosilyticus NBRC 106333 = KACC 11606]
MQLKLYTCDVLYSGMGTPRNNGAIVVSEELIVATGTPDELKQMYPQAVFAGHHRVIAPEPANAHTHLDLSAMPYTEKPYTEWIGEVIAFSRTGKRNLESALQGLTQTARKVGDIVTEENVMEALLQHESAQGIAYWEVIGVNPEHADPIFQATVERLRRWRKLERPGGMKVGLSPHTPHTVSGKLLKMLCEFADAEGFPMQIHVAEHPSELEFHTSGTGDLARAVEGWSGQKTTDILGHANGPTIVEHLHLLGVLKTRPTLIHVVNVHESDIRLIAEAGCPVVTCPRSNQALDCGVFNWPAFAQHGVEIGMGTDSTGSGKTLNILDEIQFASTLYGEEVPLRSLVRAAVKGNYRVLGLNVPFLRRGEPVSNLQFWSF